MLTTDDCLQLACQVAPELRDRLAILHEPTWPAPAGCQGWTSLGRNLQIRDALMAAGRWPGHYPMTVMFIADPAPEILLHELGHCLPALEPFSYIEPTETEREVQAYRVRQWAAGTHYLDPDRLPWATHDARWIRRVIHLVARAARLGHDVNPNALMAAGDRYGLSHVTEYMTRFASEPAMSTHKTFSEIERLPFPDPVMRLFADDVRLWAIHSLLETQ